MSGPAPEGGAGATERGGGVGEWDPPDPTTRDEPRPTLSDDDDGERAGRFWSTRRVPAALTALVVVGAAALPLYDIAAVRAGRRAMYWRRELADQLARQPLDEPWVLVAAGIAMALGLWLLALALTPGLRALLPMRRQTPLVRAGIDRDAAALTLRDRAMEVSGVRSVRVRMGRSKVKVRALSHFRELGDVRDDLDRVLTAGIRELGLDRAPALTMRVRRPVKKR
ncbi:DUF6286 domain-containing protein [Streptomyces sp. NPDC094034]|uniref:DUF6286 domain-containing protein n=1 Tax=Streptomyces sp. NPDC094034 TaxID=3155309 RepID=UPI0033202434